MIVIKQEKVYAHNLLPIYIICHHLADHVRGASWECCLNGKTFRI